MNRKQERAAKAAGIGAAPGLALEQVLANAVALHQAGKLAEAEALYRRALAAAPAQPDALHFLGVLLHQKGDGDAAIPYLERSIRIRPDSAEFHSNLGSVLQGRRQLREAAAHYRAALDLRPDYPEALNNLGSVLLLLGEPAEAADHISAALKQRPDYAEAHNNLGNTAMELGKPGEAMASYGMALELSPLHPEAHTNIGNVLKQEGRLEDAEAAHRKALELDPRYAEAHNNLAVLLRETHRLPEAEAACRKGLEIDPLFVEAHGNLGNILLDRGRHTDATVAYREALKLEPDNADIHCNMGNALRAQGWVDGAIASYRRALELDPGHAGSYDGLGIALIGQNKFGEAVAAHRKAVELEPDYAEGYGNLANALSAVRSWSADPDELEEIAAYYRKALELNPDAVGCHGNFLFFMACDRRYTMADIVAEARRWDELHAAPLAALARPHGNDPDPARRLRIGYVSPDFRAHAVSYFLEPLMEAHDHDSVELFCYAEVANPDKMTNRYRQLADHWRSTVGMTDHAVAEQVREDGIDILVDLAGHTAGNRLLAFAERPAPVQVGHLVGLGQTTGLSAMDYVLTDRWLSPRGSDGDYSEIPYRLDRCFESFQPLSDWPDISPSPARATGRVTFGSFGNVSRITSKVVETWAEILRRVDGARLVLVHKQFGDAAVREGLRSAFAAHGIDGQIAFDAVEKGWPDGMDIYRDIDIALDTWPQTGATATCITLSMGLPNVVMDSDEAHDRFGGTLLHAIGLTECIANESEDYVARAIALAGDLDSLAELRAGLRRRMAASPLLDHEGLARAVEAAYRDIWRRWCEGGSIRDLDPHGRARQ